MGLNLLSCSYAYRAWSYRLRKDRVGIAYVRNSIRSGDTVIDIGAYRGAYLYWLHKAVGKSGRVIAFEPQACLADYLCGVVKAMGHKNITVENMAISSSESVKELFIPHEKKQYSQGATLNLHNEFQNDQEGKSIQVKVKSLDSYMNNSAYKPSFLKIDTEGNELCVFQGASKLLRESRPRLLFEAEARHAGEDTVLEVFTFLKSFSYKGYFINRQKIDSIDCFSFRAHQKRQNDRFWDEPEYCNNFIFEPVECGEVSIK